jgi:hypothetical protein
MKKFLGALLAFASLTACATTPPMVQTASGRPEKEYPGVKLERVQSEIAAACMARPSIVEMASGGQVVCSKDAVGMDAVLASMVVGGSYGSTPKFKIRFTLVDMLGSIRVQAYQWVESTNAFGRVDQHELNSGEQFNAVQTMLDGVASRLATAQTPSKSAN